MDDALPRPGIVGKASFTVEKSHTTNVFGEQAHPAGLPAATDAAPDEAVRVLGTPHLLARVEFVGRESLRDHLPDGTGVVGERADVQHSRAAPVGAEIEVRTELVNVDGRRLLFDAELTRLGTGDVVGTATATFRVVYRDAFRDAVVE